jgi:replicative DNA helicase
MNEYDDRPEQAALGGLIRFPEKLDEVALFLRPEHFRRDAHLRIYRALRQLREANKPVESGSLATQLQENGELADIGGYAYLGVLLEQGPTAEGAVYHARIVHERARRRVLHATLKELFEEVERGLRPAAELAEEAQNRILAINALGATGGPVRLDKALDHYFDELDERLRGGNRQAGLNSGFPDLDRLTGGFNDGELTILAARTSVGKTSMAMQMARNAALLGQTVLFVSLEMSQSELTQRLLCGLTGVDGRRLRIGRPSTDDTDRLMEAWEQCRQAPLYIADAPSQRMTQIEATARRLKAQEKLRLLVLDYAQLVEPEDRKIPRHEQVSQVSRRLKQLAKELDIPILALAQLNREAAASDRPRLYHLKESGSLEQDADTVLLLHRPDDDENIVEVDVAKNRNGPTGSVKLVFDKSTTTFKSCAADVPYAA